MMKSSKQPLMHSATKREIDSWLSRPSHGVLLSGRRGHNQNEIADWLAGSLTSPGDNVISVPAEESIGIDKIREVLRYSKQKKTAGARLAVIIQDGGRMTVEAQNAFLKALEEPASGTYFIIACDDLSELLKTIVSRLQVVEIKPVSKKQFEAAYSGIGTEAGSKRWSIKGGLLGSGDVDDETLETAKIFISSDRYSRFQLTKDLQKDRVAVKRLIDGLYPIIGHLLKAAVAQKQPGSKIKSLLNKQRILLRSEELLELNANSKAVLSFMATNL